VVSQKVVGMSTEHLASLSPEYFGSKATAYRSRFATGSPTVGTEGGAPAGANASPGQDPGTLQDQLLRSRKTGSPSQDAQ